MDKLTHTMDTRAWMLVGPHGYQDPEDCGICIIRDRVWATRRSDGRRHVVDVVFDGPDAQKAAKWIAEQLYEVGFERHPKRLHQIAEVERGLLLARCVGAGWLSWNQES